MKQKESLSSNSAKKRRILIGCAIGATAVIMAGTGVGIGYAIWHKKGDGSGGGVPSNSLTIEYSRSFDLLGYEQVSIEPTVKTSSGVEIHDASFRLKGVLPTDLEFNPSNGVIFGRPLNLVASNSFVVSVSAIVDDIFISGFRSFDWNVTPQPGQPITDANLNTLREDIFVTSIYLNTAVCAGENTDESVRWSRNGVTDELWISESTMYGRRIGFWSDDKPTDFVDIYASTTWHDDVIIVSNTGMTFTWTQSTKTLSITYTVDVPVQSVSTNWSTNISGGTFSGYEL